MVVEATPLVVTISTLGAVFPRQSRCCGRAWERCVAPIVKLLPKNRMSIACAEAVVADRPRMEVARTTTKRVK